MTKQFKTLGGMLRSVKATLKRDGYTLSHEGKYRYGKGLLVTSNEWDLITIEQINLQGHQIDVVDVPELLELLKDYNAYLKIETFMLGKTLKTIRMKFNK
ncbi:hypothetical protein FLAPJACK_258 [Bacillus phage Flapjack]|uniref:Uncharacterized protein n=1 Tax=Bacillus phage Flapjack TaxID=1983465 RepID=A0A1X9SGJ1_9CAUD|nr:hypothetical protein FLAPJACK_258 [Bacillus phage Flapjack]